MRAVRRGHTVKPGYMAIACNFWLIEQHVLGYEQLEAGKLLARIRRKHEVLTLRMDRNIGSFRVHATARARTAIKLQTRVDIEAVHGAPRVQSSQHTVIIHISAQYGSWWR